MKRKLVLMVLVATLFLGATAAARADVRLDFDVPVLLSAGLNVSDLTGSSAISFDLSNFHIPLPYAMLAYQFGDSFLRGGIGVRAYTVLIEFVGWPMGYVEVELDRLVLRAELGGFGVVALGVTNSLLTTDIVISDFQLGYAVFPWLRLGAGVLLAAPPSNFSNNGWLFYVNARFTFDFK
jgi:hypothetical protein